MRRRISELWTGRICLLAMRRGSPGLLGRSTLSGMLVSALICIRHDWLVPNGTTYCARQEQIKKNLVVVVVETRGKINGVVQVVLVTVHPKPDQTLVLSQAHHSGFANLRRALLPLKMSNAVDDAPEEV